MKHSELDFEQDKQLTTQYSLERRIGQGCFGVLYEAINCSTKRRVAIKLQAIKNRNRQTLKREYLLLKALQGVDGVPTVYGFQRMDSCYLIQMQLLQTDLNFISTKNIEVSPANICKMGSELIRVLQKIHERGVVHRDLKPQNIMLDQNSRLYIVDFGISRKFMTQQEEGMHRQSFVGTPRYASKNAHLGHPLGPLDDIESLLYILIFLIKRWLPWMNNGVDGSKKLDQIRKTKLETKPEELAEGLPECFLLALKYVSLPKKKIDYEYLCSIFKNNCSVSGLCLQQSAEIFKSILNLGMEIRKKAQEEKKKQAQHHRNERRTSIENNHNMLQVPGTGIALDGSQMVVATFDAMGSCVDDDNEWINSMKETEVHEESVASRIQSTRRGSAFQFVEF